MSDTVRIDRENEFFQSVSQYNDNTQAEILNIEILHSYFNHKQIWEDVKSGKGKAASEEHGNGPAIIVGSGPSLEDALPLLKDWKGVIFCSSSQAASLIYYGREPEYLIMLDPRTKVEELYDVDTWEGRKTAMCTHPGMAPQTIAYWTGRKLYFRVMEPNTIFYTQVLPVGYHFIGCILFLFSCSLAAQIGLARLMGYDPIILVGCDFAAGRFRKWTYDKTFKTDKDGKIKPGKGRWFQEKRDDPWAATAPADRLVVTNNGVITEKIQLFYKRSLFCVLRLDKPNIITCSPPNTSIIDELPYVTIREVVATQGHNLEHYFLSRQELMDAMETYLATQNTWVIPIAEGIRFFENSEPEKALPGYINAFQRGGIAMDEKVIMDRMFFIKDQAAKRYPGRVKTDDRAEVRSIAAAGGAAAIEDRPGAGGDADGGGDSAGNESSIGYSGGPIDGVADASQSSAEAIGEKGG